MRRDEFVNFVKERQEELITLLDRKGIEYSNPSSAFYNFDEGHLMSTAFTREAYAWDLMAKHLQSMKDIITNKVNVDLILINEKCGDISLYCLLIWTMLYENQNLQKT